MEKRTKEKRATKRNGHRSLNTRRFEKILGVILAYWLGKSKEKRGEGSWQKLTLR